MPVAACGVSCDVCGLYVKRICGTCVAGTDEKAPKKLAAQMKLLNKQCPILACAIERKVPYCLKDCDDFPCAHYESGLWKGPFPYSTSFLNMFRKRIGKQLPKTDK